MEDLMIFLWVVGFLYTWGRAIKWVGEAEDKNFLIFAFAVACLFFWPVALGALTQKTE